MNPEYTTSLESALAVMKEINRIQAEKNYLEWFKAHAPLVAKELKRLGVKFPK